MYKIDKQKLKNELKYRRKNLIIELLLSLIVIATLLVVYFIITKKNISFGIAAICLSIISILFIVQTIIDIISLKKCIKDSVYLTNKGYLLKKQKISINNSFITKPCLYYIDKNYKIYKLKIRHAIDLFNKSSLDLLIDINNPKRYYIDTCIDTTSKFDLEKNNKPFKDMITYPGLAYNITKNNSLISNITTFIILVGFFIYVGIMKEDSIIRGAALAASLILSIEVFKNLSKIIKNNNRNKEIIYLLKNGKLYTDIKYKIDKKKDSNGNVILKINHNDKTYLSDRIKYYPEKDKVSLLINEKTDKYVIDYDIEYIDKINS